jgi:hypothetical protein
MSSNPEKDPGEPGSPSDRFLPPHIANPGSSSQEALANTPHLTSSGFSVFSIAGYGTSGQNVAFHYDPSSPGLGSETSQAVGNVRNAPKINFTPEEDTKIVKLRNNGTSWPGIAQQMHGRTALGCRLRYQNYLEREVQWSEVSLDNLARVYAR